MDGSGYGVLKFGSGSAKKPGSGSDTLKKSSEKHKKSVKLKNTPKLLYYSTYCTLTVKMRN